MKWLYGITDSMDTEFEQLWDREAWHAAVRGVTKRWRYLVTEQQHTNSHTVFQYSYIPLTKSLNII